jgi:hypothetical protein
MRILGNAARADHGDTVLGAHLFCSFFCSIQSSRCRQSRQLAYRLRALTRSRSPHCIVQHSVHPQQRGRESRGQV